MGQMVADHGELFEFLGEMDLAHFSGATSDGELFEFLGETGYARFSRAERGEGERFAFARVPCLWTPIGAPRRCGLRGLLCFHTHNHLDLHRNVVR